ncbi:MAG: acyl--CoA ligase [Gammaproteobacteria bacterium]|nr:acyl--CoA ligase [Gammaproteobacteria bacterium]
MDAIIDLLRGEANAPAVSALSRRGITHGELRAQTAAFGRQLRAADIGPDDRVALVLPNGPAMAAAFVGLAPWCATAPLNPAYKPDEFAFYLEDLDARALVVADGTDSVAVEVAKSRGIRVLRLRESRTAGAVHLDGIGEARAELRGDDAISLILHTSGTTSRPKMVPLSQANLAASARTIARTLHLVPGDRCLNIMPLFHIHGLMAPVLASLSAGGEVVCSPGFDALRFFSWLADTEPTWYSAVPTMHQAILARAGRNEEAVRGNRLRFIRSSSASLPTTVMASLEKVLDAPVIEAYAMTEAAHQMCSNPLPPAARKPGSVGPAAGPEVAILDDRGRGLPAATEGEIAIRGPNVTTGYLNNPEANACAFHGDWFRTGDQGVMDDDGYIRVTGRLKEIINRGGEKIAPLEVDEVLLAHEAVAQACTFALPHARLGEDVAAAIVLVDGADVTDRDLRNFVAERLADFKTPRRIAFVDEIPKGPTGKIQRIGLAKALGFDS